MISDGSVERDLDIPQRLAPASLALGNGTLVALFGIP